MLENKVALVEFHIICRLKRSHLPHRLKLLHW